MLMSLFQKYKQNKIVHFFMLILYLTLSFLLYQQLYNYNYWFTQSYNTYKLWYPNFHFIIYALKESTFSIIMLMMIYSFSKLLRLKVYATLTLLISYFLFKINQYFFATNSFLLIMCISIIITTIAILNLSCKYLLNQVHKNKSKIEKLNMLINQWL